MLPWLLVIICVVLGGSVLALSVIAAFHGAALVDEETSGEKPTNP
jgi:hypothetical protein